MFQRRRAEGPVSNEIVEVPKVEDGMQGVVSFGNEDVPREKNWVSDMGFFERREWISDLRAVEGEVRTIRGGGMDRNSIG